MKNKIKAEVLESSLIAVVRHLIKFPKFGITENYKHISS